MQVDHNISVPLYQQIKSVWKARIENGILQPGDRIPTERELCALYKVSQITVKQAIRALVAEGLLVRRPRTGTYVAQPKFRQQLLKLTSFSEDMRQRGLTPGGHVISMNTEPADAKVADALKVPEGEPIFRLERVRLAGDEPMAVETLRIPVVLCPGLAQEELESKSLYNLLQEKFGLVLDHAEQSFEASKATAREAKLLRVSRHAAVLRVERLTFDPRHKPVEYTLSVYRGDRYKLHVTMSRNG